ncbi:MAG: DNA internalization-related competence protein ComEC/Rec2 [Chrysiogenales bacterium]
MPENFNRSIDSFEGLVDLFYPHIVKSFMRDIFTPIFLSVLAALFLIDAIAVNPFIFTPLAVVVFVFYLILFYFKKYRLAYAVVVLSMVLLLSGSFLKQKDAFERDREIALPLDIYITIRGTLLAYPEIGNDSSQLLLLTQSFHWPGQKINRSLNVRINCRGDCRNFNRGDRVEAAVRIQPQHLNKNFYPNPYEKYLLYKKLNLTGYTKSTQLLRVTARANIFWRLIGAWRERIREKIEAHYLKNGRLQPPGVFLEATILGDRGRLENSTQEELIAGGVFHLLAISGANIGMLALFSLLLCRWLHVPLKPRYFITSLLLLLFLVISGFDISAQRAVLMGLLLFVARAYFMDVQLSNVISFCGLLLLVLNPAQVLDPGYILTFALTATLLIGRRIFLPLLKRLPRYAAELLTANFSASLLALPLSLYFFQRYSFSGFFSGLLLVPLAGAVTICGAGLLFLAPLPLGVAQLALLPARILLVVFFTISRWFFDHLALSIFRPSPPLLLLASIGLLFYAISLEKIKIKFKFLPGFFMLGLFVVISLPPQPYRPGQLEVYFLDVGHGDAELAVFPGGDALLIDAGGASFSDFQTGRRCVLPFIIQKKIRVRWTAVSHYHPDHVKGIAEIIGILQPEELWISSEAVDDEFFRQLLAAKPKKTILRKIQRGFVKDISGCSISCLSPPRFIQAEQAENNHSMVLRVSDGRASFLFGGDIEKSVEAELADTFGSGLASTVLKVPHHGSRTSSSARFLDSVQPRLAIISVPAYSSYGFPNAEVINRLKQRNIRWLSTARSGGIRIASLPDGLGIEVSK